ncbi:Phage portal protein [Xanthomonas phage Suba]|uniref:Phage portal protein n=1 Tax=Xanthomonas phage Suba TaxID=2674975 RepID=A0A679KKG7_9CAUD|nr:Phage portal protein [Xanthomonas phage Suba]CAA2409734.1 Phage portal protein [Xanthomonas phage Suba]
MAEYAVIRDCIAGETAVKAKREAYLPFPDESRLEMDPDVVKEGKARYDAYLTRAVFYNATRRTLDGLTGQVFMRDPVCEIPAQMSALKADVSGTGISLFQSAEMSLQEVVSYSRAGVFVDFPDTTERGASADDVASGRIRPTLYSYNTFEILNWRVKEIDSSEVLSLVVLMEGFPMNDDGFEVKYGPQVRVLRLNEANEYVQEIWRQVKPTEWSLGAKIPKGNEFRLHSTYYPTMADGSRAKRIPFWFIGSRNNDANPENPNFYDLASLNIAHYRNSADYEECCFLLGQPTLVVTGMQQKWLTEVLKGKLNFGSRGGIPLEAESDAKLITAEENSMIKEAMDDKVKQMKGLGAKLVEERGVQRTATETRSDNASESSVLASCANNVSVAYTAALVYAAELMGLGTNGIKFELNKDFDLSAMSPEEQRLIVELWQKGAISWPEMRTALRRAGKAFEDDNKVKAEIEADTLKQMEMAASVEGAAPTGAE